MVWFRASVSAAPGASSPTHWFAENADQMAHPYQADLESHCPCTRFRMRCVALGAGWAARRHQLEAVERWYRYGWTRLDTRLRSSITEGVVVFLSLFDDNLAVQRAFCPPRRAYAGELQPGEPTPIPPLAELLETGRVLALNFPVGMNPGLARILGVMLKLDFQRAVLQRIPQITAEPERVWRDLLFVCDEYHAFARRRDGPDRRRAHVRALPTGPADRSWRPRHQLASLYASGESWRTRCSVFGRLFLATSDEFTANGCGRVAARSTEGALHRVESDGRSHLASDGPGDRAPAIAEHQQGYAPHHEVPLRHAYSQLQNAQAIACL